MLFSLSVLAVSVAGPASAYDKAAFVAPKDKALVVFIQNRREDQAMSYLVVDRELRCLAEVGGREAKVAEMPPGAYTFFISGYRTQRIDMELAPGRTYFVRIFSYERAVLRNSDVTPVQRGTDSYVQVKSWLSGARITKASDDPCHGKPIKKGSRRMVKNIMGADIDWEEGDELYHARYSLLRVDGFTAKEIDWL